MSAVDPSRVASAVQRNCHIADATFAQSYSLCVYLLKMREFYRWEQGIGPTEVLSREAIGDFVEAREQLWDDVESESFSPIPIGNDAFDPFAVEAINARLRPHRLVYSGGVGRFGQPNFFLARLSRTDRDGDLTVHVCGEELARDLTAPPAMLLGAAAFVRRESLRRQLWESVEEWQWRRAPGPMAWLYEHYGFDADPAGALERMVDDEVDLAIAHERGEHRVGVLLGDGWRDALAACAGEREEPLLRAAGDHLADALVTLPGIVGREDAAALMRFGAGLRGHRKDLAPALAAGLREWLATGGWSAIARLVGRSRTHWQAAAERIVAADRRSPEALAALLDPDRLRFTR